MASFTLKNIPDPLLERLRERAESDRRSLTQEILFLLEEALRGAGGRSRADTEAGPSSASFEVPPERFALRAPQRPSLS